MEHNIKTFGKLHLGVHGQELPKFADDDMVKEYWKLREDYYQPNPKNLSQLEYKQQVKYWAKPDEIRLADVKETAPKGDPLKVFEALPEKTEEICKKVNEIYPEVKDQSETNFAAKPMDNLQKWNAIIASTKPSVYQENPKERASFIKKEDAPLYSSFSPNKIFQDSLQSAGSLTK